MAKVKTTKSKAFSKETYLEWYELMLRIRKFEERANLMYFQKKIRGFLHLCIGQEAVYAGMKTATRPNDAWITAYRQHGAAMAKGVDSNSAMAELYGKYTGNVKGKGGSMHFFSAEHRFYGGHGIVGGQIGLGAGIAFADKYKDNDNVTFCLFGDGACRQGILHETFNMAMNWKLPVVFICENNFYAMGTSVERTSNVTDIYKLGLGYDMPSKQIDGMDVEVVHNEIAAAAEHCRSGKGPMFLEIRTYRYKGHSMSDPAKYRTKDEEKEYKAKDPINIIEAALLKKKHATAEDIDAIKAKVKEEIDAAVQFAEDSPFPPVEEIYTDNYEQKDYPFIMD
ncbi:pyruvate dehydrogenase (acetyl-transferring) E1 component subunit alpha [Aureispira anguillae]|uniref:Pyruvate dehydrogenase E1 component subunit alpha n=1 Tax=Aureispira anguillae TaxID=2864201 RepID=A0A916DSU0_9BACT|nr:pyruvate dehydrogenase (acetyl-transferring) E1 component subunit alpha [Aureispira anguillae]BDS12111.1 pyruvate dehydrogenase (acetyl-transferring) E1 component subunit alpha [Aureispira anguillae]